MGFADAGGSPCLRVWIISDESQGRWETDEIMHSRLVRSKPATMTKRLQQRLFRHITQRKERFLWPQCFSLGQAYPPCFNGHWLGAERLAADNGKKIGRVYNAFSGFVRSALR